MQCNGKKLIALVTIENVLDERQSNISLLYNAIALGGENFNMGLRRNRGPTVDLI